MAVARDKSSRNEKTAPALSRPGFWINIARPESYMDPSKISPEEFERLFHKDNLGKWSPKTLSASSCGLRLKWHRDDAKGSRVTDDNDRRVAGERNELRSGEFIPGWSCDKNIREGDLSLFYRTDPAKDIRYLFLAKGNVRRDEEWKWVCDCEVAYKFQVPLPLESIRRAGVHIRQATAIPVKPADWRRLNEMLAERNRYYPEEVRENFGVDIFAGIPPLQAEPPVVVPAGRRNRRRASASPARDSETPNPTRRWRTPR